MPRVTNALDTQTILDMIMDPLKREAVQTHYDTIDEDYGISFVESMKSKMCLATNIYREK